MNLNLPQRQKWLILLAAIAVGLLILDRIAFTPLTRLWRAHAAEIVQLQKSVANGHGVLERGPRTRQVWTEMQSGALPRDPAQAEQNLLTSFDQWGRGSNVEVASIKPQWKKGSDRYSLLECRVDASGSLAALTRFLYEVERSPLALRVDSVALTSRDDYGTKLNLALVVSGLRFVPLEGRR